MSKNVIVMGSGFSSLSAACYLAQAGFKVDVYEKNSWLGGRARVLQRRGYTFDMGPTFYWMPDVFESFFTDFGYRVEDLYSLKRLSPAYRIYFDKDRSIVIGDSIEEIYRTFESIESGSAAKLHAFMQEAEDNYHVAIRDLVYQPGESIFELITLKTARKLNLFVKSIDAQVNGIVKHPWLRMLLKFPVLFLGAKPSTTPAFYNFMNYADYGLGTWQPEGGMHTVVDAMQHVALDLGVTFHTDSNVSSINIDSHHGRVESVTVNGSMIPCDILLSGADYAHTEKLLSIQHRQYESSYWESRTYAPSALLFYVAFNTKLKNVDHHTLFFDVDFEKHASEIYDKKVWPDEPLFYASFPSITESTFAPEGCEAGTFLIPVAVNLEDTPEIRSKYLKLIIHRLEYLTGQSLADSIVFHESFGISDFKEDYNSFGGNAYGLANTLRQTHILRPRLKSKKVSNLYFTGQLTIPGPGVPPSLISGKIVSTLITKYEAAL